MKKIFTILFAVTLFLTCQQASAQTIIYNQSFDATTMWPSGWYATPNSWYLDTTNGNISSGYNNATGGNNIVVKDTNAALGKDSLITPAISTVGYHSITVEWGARFSKHFADSGSTIGLYWSANGSAWTSISYTENTNNSLWALENGATPIALPAGAANQASLKLMWVADIHFTPSGTYRIDDLNVAGTPSTGIEDVNANDVFAHIYAGSSSNINISMQQPVTESLHVEIFDLTGSLISKTDMNTQSLTINARNLSAGLYLVRVSDSNRSTVTKVSLK